MGHITNNEFTINYKVRKEGDLLHRMYFEVDLPSQNMENSITGDIVIIQIQPHIVLKNVSISIGEKLIDTHDLEDTMIY